VLKKTFLVFAAAFFRDAAKPS